jgi:hypothetical protein
VTNPRNYRKNPHTARFLQVFHSANGANYAPEARSDVDEERTAMNFLAGVDDSYTRAQTQADRAEVAVTGEREMQSYRAPRNGETIVQVSGHPVKIGPAFVTEAQAKWIIDIATTRETPGPAEAVLIRLEQGFARSAGSQFITSYKDLPKKSKTISAEMAEAIAPGASDEDIAASLTEVPAGRYAVVDPTDSVLKFFKLDRPTAGKWAGYTFLKIQASDELFPVRDRAKKSMIMAEIAKDVEAAARAYGQKLGRCYACGRTLTDATSRELGIGPDCRSK